MERLTPLARSVPRGRGRRRRASLAIGSFAVFEGPAPAFDEFVRPHRRAAAADPALPAEAPPWSRSTSPRRPGSTTPTSTLRRHVRRTALPAPGGGPEESARLMSRVMTRRMDRRRPLWEYWFCEGLEDGRWALLSKLHHCMVDGVSGTDLYQLVLDPDPGAAPRRGRPLVARDPAPPAADRRTPPRPPGDLSGGAGRASGRGHGRPRACSPRHTLRPARRRPALAGRSGRSVPPPSPADLSGSRRYAWTEISLTTSAPVRQGSRRHGERRRARRGLRRLPAAPPEPAARTPTRTPCARWCRSRRASRARSPSPTTGSP